jgi:hypothetical protein
LAYDGALNSNSGVAESATITFTEVNDTPTGSVSLSGVVKTGQTLTASNNIADDDGMIGSTIAYQWSKASGGVTTNIGTDSTTYVLTDADIGSTITATASYTDNASTSESVTSADSIVVTDIVKLLQIRGVDSVTASQASQDAYGVDYTSGSTESMIKFELWLDAEGINTIDANAIAIESGSLDLDWSTTQLKAVDVNLAGATGSMIFSKTSDAIQLNEVTGVIAFADDSAIVDIDNNNNNGASGVPLEKYIATLWVTPKSGVNDVQVVLNSMSVSTEDGVDITSMYSYNVDIL